MEAFYVQHSIQLQNQEYELAPRVEEVTIPLGSDNPPSASPCQDPGPAIIHIEVSTQVRHIFSLALEWGTCDVCLTTS